MQKAVEKFISRVEREGLYVEGVAVADEKKVLFEHRFTPDAPRNIYSHTKSYVSVAVGIAVGEGLLSLDDKPALFFEDRLKGADPRVYEITLRHLLTMSSGWGKFFLGGAGCRAGEGYPDYIAYLLSQPIQFTPGERFVYSNGDTYLAGRMLAKAAGKKVQNFAYERLLRPIGLPYAEWATDPEGHALGATGLRLTLTEMLRLGQVLLADGKWEGNQVVPKAWIREATSLRIELDEPNAWSMGYGYQFWLPDIEGAYRMDGAFGQITTVLPSAGLAVAVQCPEHGDFDKVRPVYCELLDDLLH